MFAIPRPPKDYVLRTVPGNQRSSQQFTPGEAPRVTQTNFGRFLAPVEYADDEFPSELHLDPVHPYIAEKWARERRAWWVDPPGTDDYRLHDAYRRYSVKVQDTYDPRYMVKEKCFNRSYKYELDCLEESRLQKLKAKCERELNEFEENFQKLEHRQKAREPPKIKIEPCKEEPPFWWEKEEKVEKKVEEKKRVKLTTKEKAMYDSKNLDAALRWTEEPNLTGIVVDDPCKRKYEMNKVGQPFKNEAINWYYVNHPPPDVTWRTKKFS